LFIYENFLYPLPFSPSHPPSRTVWRERRWGSDSSVRVGVSCSRGVVPSFLLRACWNTTGTSS
jgi:hypothetical protein